MDDLLEDYVLLKCRVNEALVETEVNPGLSLLDFLREECGLTGTHMGCMTGHCGACTVMIDGEVAKSCLTLAASVTDRRITTIEGIANENGSLHPVQQAFWDESGLQCAFCAPGMVLATVALLRGNPEPNDREIREAIAGNLCRCTGYQSIVRAVHAASKLAMQVAKS